MVFSPECSWSGKVYARYPGIVNKSVMLAEKNRKAASIGLPYAFYITLLHNWHRAMKKILIFRKGKEE